MMQKLGKEILVHLCKMEKNFSRVFQSNATFAYTSAI
jgi:hypothetical protein